MASSKFVNANMCLVNKTDLYFANATIDITQNHNFQQFYIIAHDTNLYITNHHVTLKDVTSALTIAKHKVIKVRIISTILICSVLALV